MLVRRAPRRLNLQCTSLMLSVFANLFTLLPFSNSVLAKLTIYRYVSCGFLAHPEILVSPRNRYNVAI